jgi:Family of unknown function (DUF6174)
MRILSFFLSMLGLVACTAIPSTLEERSLWTSKNLTSYSYTLQRGCFCATDALKAMRLEVRNGTLTSIKYVDSGLDVPENLRPNIFKIEAFFDLIDSTRAKGGTVEKLSFDATLGYPSQMLIDPIPDATDNAITYNISDLKALGSLLSEARALWNSKNLNSYVYTKQIGCFCPEQYTKAMRLEVRDGALTSAKYLDSGLEVPTNFRPVTFKIEAFFDLIDSTRAKGGTVENLEFDPIFGYPTKKKLDPIPQAVDDESFHSLSDLKAL